MCRFINADEYASTGQGFVGCNMFAYCLNNPVNYIDSGGDFALSFSLLYMGSMAFLVVAIFAVSPEGQALNKSIVEGVYKELEQVQEAVATVPERVEGLIEEGKKALSKARTYARAISVNNEKYVVHHIVAKSHPDASPARIVLESVGINPTTNGLNLAVIPECMHKSMHTKKYYFYVNNCFDGLYGNEEAVIQTLARLQFEIQLYCHTGINRW